MSRWERSGERDLAFSQWHRHAFDDHADAFDIDLVGTCKKCRTPLYVIESTRDTSRNKPTTMLQGAARTSGAVAVLVYYATNGSDLAWLDAHRVWPDRMAIGNQTALVLYLNELRRQHMRLYHDQLTIPQEETA